MNVLVILSIFFIGLGISSIGLIIINKYETIKFDRELNHERNVELFQR